MGVYKKILLGVPVVLALIVPGFALQQPSDTGTEARYKAKYGRLFPATERAQREFQEAFATVPWSFSTVSTTME
ncbi:MAG: hypothetical protein ACRD7E_24190, partial [Bryobacteraceae bacterium]